MNEKLASYLSRYMSLTEDLAEALMDSSLVQELPKGTVLLREGEPVRKGYFILKGCIRSYILKDGDDKTLEFYVEEETVLLQGFGRDLPSEQFLECVEDTVAVVGTPDQE